MWRAFASEWVKLRRRSMLLWGIGGMLFFTVLATAITIRRATNGPVFGEGGHGFRVSVQELSQPNGLVHGIVHVASLVGIVVLALYAGATATEYSQGTLRNLLVRQPGRIKLLSGKFLALALFVLISVVLAVLVGAAVAFALGPGKGIHTSAWTSSTGLNDTFQATLHIYLASLGYGVLGTALAVILRSPAVAVALGVAYALPGEAIIVGALWDGGHKWLPGQLLDAIANGGNGNSAYGRALLIIALYAALVSAGTLYLFRRRDV